MEIDIMQMEIISIKILPQVRLLLNISKTISREERKKNVFFYVENSCVLYCTYVVWK